MRSNFSDFRAFADEIQRIEAAKKDFVAPMGMVEMYDPGHVTIRMPEGDVGFGLTNNGHRQLAEKMGVPWDYYDKTAKVPGLREFNVNAWAKEKKEEKKLLRTLDGNVRAVLGKNFKPMDNFFLLDALLPALKETAGSAVDNLVMRTYALTEDHLYLQVGFPLTKLSVVRSGVHEAAGIPLMAGLTFRNSEVGKARLEVRKTVWNLACWNGLITEVVLSMVHLGKELDGGENGENGNIWSDETLNKARELIQLKARDIIRDAMDPDALKGYADKARAAMEDRIEGKVEDAVQEVTRRFKFSFTEDETSFITENVLTQGVENKNRWGLANGINFLAHKIESADRQYDVERLAAEVIELKPGQWEMVA